MLSDFISNVQRQVVQSSHLGVSDSDIKVVKSDEMDKLLFQKMNMIVQATQSQMRMIQIQTTIQIQMMTQMMQATQAQVKQHTQATPAQVKHQAKQEEETQM